MKKSMFLGISLIAMMFFVYGCESNTENVINSGSDGIGQLNKPNDLDVYVCPTCQNAGLTGNNLGNYNFVFTMTSTSMVWGNNGTDDVTYINGEETLGSGFRINAHSGVTTNKINATSYPTPLDPFTYTWYINDVQIGTPNTSGQSPNFNHSGYDFNQEWNGMLTNTQYNELTRVRVVISDGTNCVTYAGKLVFLDYSVMY